MEIIMNENVKVEEYVALKNSIYFDSEWYKKNYLYDEINTDPIYHYLTKGWLLGYNPSLTFITEAYLENYPDVKKAQRNPLVHFIFHGMREKRQPGYSVNGLNLIKKSRLFNRRWYENRYHEDISERKMDPLIHYMVYGWKKGFDPSKKFCTKTYLNTYDDVKNANVCPLLHYLTKGINENRKIYKVKKNIYKSGSTLFSQFKRKFYQFVYREDIAKHSEVKIAVHVHLYYEEFWYEIKNYLKNLEVYKFDLFITCVNAISDEISSDINNFKNDVKIIRVRNVGFDLGPFIYVLRSCYLYDYDVIFKIHTKRDVKPLNYYGVYMQGGEWRHLSYNSLLNERNVHLTINKLVEHKDVGMVAYKDFITGIDSVYNKEKTIKTMEEYGFSVPQDYLYIIGTMFASKGCVFKEMIAKKVSYYDFEQAKRGCFTRAHSFERILCLNTIAQGYSIVGNDVFWPARFLRNIQSKIYPYNPPCILEQDTLQYVRFYKKFNSKEHKSISVCEKLKVINEDLYNALISKASIDLSKDEPLSSESFEYMILMKDYVIDRKIAEIKGPVENTIFRFVGNEITVEKQTLQKKHCFLKVCNQAPQFILHGKYLMSIVKDYLIRGKLDALIGELKPYICKVFERYATNNNNVLKPNTWDAIPRNVIIDANGNYNFFDTNIQYIPGVDKSYFLYRVALDIFILAKDLQLSISHRDFVMIYENLCKMMNIGGNFLYYDKLEKQLQFYFLNKNTKIQFSKDLLATIFNYLHLNNLFYRSNSKFKVVTEDYLIVKKSKLFDESWYVSEYQISSDIAPAYHFASEGWRLGFNPSLSFDTERYLRAYPDIADAGVNPLVHWEKNGCKESGRLMFSVNADQSILYPQKYVFQNDRKHVLLVSHVLNHTGAPILLLHVAKMYRSIGIDCMVLAPKHGDIIDDFLNENIPVIVDENCLVPDSNIVLPCKFDFCICNTFITWGAYITFSKTIKTIWWIHDNILPHQVHSKLKEVFKNAENVYVPCELTKTYVSNYNDDVKILNYPIFNLVKSCSRKEHDLIKIGVYATLQSRKGQDVFVQAISMLPSYIRKKCLFLIVGDEAQKDFKKTYISPYMKKYKEIIHKHNISNLSTYHDSLDDLDLLCCPSREDPYPLVVIDALMHGCPVIISDHVGEKDIINNRDNGFIFQSENICELSLIIQDIVENRSALPIMSERARQTYIDHFDYVACSKIFKQLMDE